MKREGAAPGEVLATDDRPKALTREQILDRLSPERHAAPMVAHLEELYRKTGYIPYKRAAETLKKGGTDRRGPRPKDDSPYLNQMVHLLATDNARTAWAAACQVAKESPGHRELSTAKRLHAAFKREGWSEYVGPHRAVLAHIERLDVEITRLAAKLRQPADALVAAHRRAHMATKPLEGEIQRIARTNRQMHRLALRRQFQIKR